MQPNPNHRGDPVFLPQLLREWGVTVREHPGWRDRGHGDFGRIIGVVAHHTGHNATGADYIARHPQLGLCAQIHLARDGVATITGAGIAWHAGQGSYPGWPANNANAVSIGIEAQSDGTSPWPQAELDAYVRICAAICWYLGLPATAVIGHKEWAGAAQGKWDPGGIDMNDFRNRVAAEIKRGPTATAPVGQKGATVSFDQIQARYPSRVEGSTVTMRPLDALLNADAHAFVARANTERILTQLADITRRLDALEAKEAH
ncbi:N-acetylmuramoyl-L-alanine amidase [Corynebacterium sp. 13CS0277]|uniref:peptidoglycan recognition protein family protein n=1 Tax=Corynebacterium sp. 13CS0277 TaxID=2071994 RepID=UPI000D026EDE|nr:N-acetylmuramoyl-L-alanine amidase [Corynebacterium sp. 13CS0277]PRQ11707.1 N-acetylmuramoyl-L-alanine amidase [Corynebacterium sp. 13CS0277]